MNHIWNNEKNKSKISKEQEQTVRKRKLQWLSIGKLAQNHQQSEKCTLKPCYATLYLQKIETICYLLARMGEIYTLFTISRCRQEKAMASHSSTVAWKVPWMEEPGRLQSMGSHRVGHDWSDLAAAAADVDRLLRWH